MTNLSYVITLIGKSDIPAEFIASVQEIFAKLSVVSQFEIQLDGSRVLDYSVEIPIGALAELKIDLFDLSTGSGVDIIVQPTENRLKKLFIFDMDSTLIEQEVIELIAARANVEAQVAEITERAMNGELDFNASLAERVALLKGIESTSLFDELKTQLVFTNGVKELCKVLGKTGVKMAVLSGGFTPLAKYVAGELGLDYAHANNLEDEDGKLTGKTYGEIVNGDKKAELLQRIAAENNIELDQVCAVGDGANDLPMMGVAGFGIAWTAKPVVQEKAPSRLNSGSLRDVLYILGYSKGEQEELLK
jgi:phosphoserine phosphatase